MKWAGNVACGMYGERGGAHYVLMGKPLERKHLGELGVDGRIISKCIFKKNGRAWTGLIWLKIGRRRRKLL